MQRKARAATLLGLVLMAVSLTACNSIHPQTTAEYFAYLENKPGPR